MPELTFATRWASSMAWSVPTRRLATAVSMATNTNATNPAIANRRTNFRTEIGATRTRS